MKRILTIVGVLSFLTVVGHTEPNTFTYKKDVQGGFGPVLSLETYNNQTDGTTTAQDLSCTSTSKVYCLEDDVGGAYLSRDNGAGDPPTGAITDGTAWTGAATCRMITDVSNTAWTHVRVKATVASNTIRIHCWR